MNTERIEQLLEKYWLCETSVAEEEELRSFFLQEAVPGHLAKYKAMFEIQQEDTEAGLDEQFEERILQLIQEDKEEKKPVRKFTLRPVLQIAASIAVILGLWFSIQYLNQDHNDPWKQDTYQNPEQALAEVQKVLSMVSGQMERGQEFVMGKVEKAEPLTNIINK